jgi:hypothetical protein
MNIWKIMNLLNLNMEKRVKFIEKVLKFRNFRGSDKDQWRDRISKKGKWPTRKYMTFIKIESVKIIYLNSVKRSIRTSYPNGNATKEKEKKEILISRLQGWI